MSPEYYLKISPETFRGLVELLAVLIMFIGLIAVIWHRFKLDLGLSNVSLQFVAVIFVFPTILILSLESVSHPVARIHLGTEPSDGEVQRGPSSD